MADDIHAGWNAEAEEMERLRRDVQDSDAEAVARELRIYREVFARIDADELEAALAIVQTREAELRGRQRRCSMMGTRGRNRGCRWGTADS